MIIVRNRQTVVMGGLVTDNIVSSVNKVPWLGDIPILGWLFKFESRHPVKTNLLIFLTPYIVNGSEDLTAITFQKSQEISGFVEGNKVENLEKRREFLGTINPPKPEPKLPSE